MPISFKEDHISQIPALLMLEKLGYTYLTPDEALALRGGNLANALRRFKRNCAKAGIQQEIRKREHYEKPSVRRKKKSEAARKRKYN